VQITSQQVSVAVSTYKTLLVKSSMKDGHEECQPDWRHSHQLIDLSYTLRHYSCSSRPLT